MSSCAGVNQLGKMSTTLSTLLPRNTSADYRSECRKSIVMSAGMSMHLVGIGLERGIATWDGMETFDFIISAEVGGESGDSMGCRTLGSQRIFYPRYWLPILVWFRFRTFLNPKLDQKNHSARFRFRFRDFPELDRWSGSRFREMFL